MIGYEAITKDRKIQINDRLETMCVIREVRPDEEYEVKEDTSNYVIVHALNKKWYVAPISHVTIPVHGVGLEIFNADGRCMFSSSVRLVPFVSWYDVNMNTAGRGQITVREKQAIDTVTFRCGQWGISGTETNNHILIRRPLMRYGSGMFILKNMN